MGLITRPLTGQLGLVALDLDVGPDGIDAVGMLVLDTLGIMRRCLDIMEIDVAIG